MTTKRPVKIATFSELEDRTPAYALVAKVDLVVIRHDGAVSVLYGRCLHRGALLSDGHVDGPNLICGLHGWDYRYDTGVSAYNNEEALRRFDAWVEDDGVLVDEAEVAAWEVDHPQPYERDAYLGLYEDHHGGPEEPYNIRTRRLAVLGPDEAGHHGPVSSMGVPLTELPRWESLQLLTAQLARKPKLDHDPVGTEIVIGPNAAKPLTLAIPIFVSDMSFGALSEEAKVALAKGAEGAGTGICSGEGGMLPEEQAANSRYFYELASAKFGWSIDKVKQVQAFHFKAGQGAKTGTGGHLPGEKVKGKIAKVRELAEGTPAISPSTFSDLDTPADFQRVADEVREVSGGIPIGFKLSAQHIEADVDFALAASADYIILDGRGGGTGAAPEVFKNNISVPTMIALARARRHLDARGRRDVTLIITGGLRTESDFVKAMALGADAVAVSNAAMQAIGCLGMRACHTNNCPVGIATQKPGLRSRLIVDKSAQQLTNFFLTTVNLMKVLARACGHAHLDQFCLDDLTTYDRDLAYLTGVPYAGVVPL
ncbi:ferredoxin-dependent glutamate synthase [Plesiocystis pacifica SIR-1]|uniref:Ferredoxin-dependent glutamate synthase n=1 Tax=Plesiocystis pacifica SIR-1 TaxID=391625 RepID=A6G0J1_9BACT|nr:glutamate synthase-related protein [Plesiocystis pacifica]EDM80637.1 ferredoxin-dependent glutamate synthase [Plesiocystis pacifica SIR-1]